MKLSKTQLQESELEEDGEISELEFFEDNQEGFEQQPKLEYAQSVPPLPLPPPQLPYPAQPFPALPLVPSYPQQIPYQVPVSVSNYLQQPIPALPLVAPISQIPYQTPNYSQQQLQQPQLDRVPPLTTSTTYSVQQQVSNYSQPALQLPLPVPLPVPPRYLPSNSQLIGYNGSYAQSSLFNKYSPLELALFLPFIGYRANHYSLFYYRNAPYRQCPKNIYLAQPSYSDIQSAFAYARQILVQSQSATIQYLNSTQPSAAARHQIFHFMAQQNALSDEEGLLVELVSQYLSDRACLTKWDKQRYLPQLTKFVSVSNFPSSHSCFNYYRNNWNQQLKYCAQNKFRTIDGFCNNLYHPYWGKSNVCHIRLLSPDYADGISAPRVSYYPKVPLPNPRLLSNLIHFELPIDGPYNLLKMQWGQFINHDITNTALSSYEGLIDCCKNPTVRGCLPIYVPPYDKFYGSLNVTCLNFIRSGVCPLCQLGPRQQLNKNTAYLDLSHVYGNTPEQATKLRAFQGGLLRVSIGRNGEILLPVAGPSAQEQCSGTCFVAGDSRANQHPALTALQTLLLRNHNILARNLALRHPNWNDELLFQEARRLNIAEYQMITYNEYFPIVFGPILTAYYKLLPQRAGYTTYDPKVDPTTWNEYSTATCRFGHSQISAAFGLYSRISGYGQPATGVDFRLKEWFMRPSFLSDGRLPELMNGLMVKPAQTVDPWLVSDVRNHLYQSHKEFSGGDLAATNIQRAREHGIPGYVYYLEYCFNYKVRSWRDLSLFIPYYTLNQLRKVYRVVENIDLFTGGLSERHFPGADIGPTFACVNGIQYFHLKYGDRFYFEHGGQVGSFNPAQLEDIRRSTLARLICRTAFLPVVPQFAFLAASQFNPLINCTQLADFNYNLF